MCDVAIHLTNCFRWHANIRKLFVKNSRQSDFETLTNGINWQTSATLKYKNQLATSKLPTTTIVGFRNFFL